MGDPIKNQVPTHSLRKATLYVSSNFFVLSHPKVILLSIHNYKLYHCFMSYGPCAVQSQEKKALLSGQEDVR